MFGTGKEQVSKLRLSHLLPIYEYMEKISGLSDDLTLSIVRHSRDYYTVDWQRNDHFGGAIEFIFDGNKIKETKKIGSWIS